MVLPAGGTYDGKSLPALSKAVLTYQGSKHVIGLKRNIETQTKMMLLANLLVE